MARKYLIEVEGRGTFPFDMLRYDGGSFASDKDREVAEASGRGLRYVTLVCEERPTHGRWASFMWNVIKEERA